MDWHGIALLLHTHTHTERGLRLVLQGGNEPSRGCSPVSLLKQKSTLLWVLYKILFGRKQILLSVTPNSDFLSGEGPWSGGSHPRLSNPN